MRHHMSRSSAAPDRGALMGPWEVVDVFLKDDGQRTGRLPQPKSGVGMGVAVGRVMD